MAHTDFSQYAIVFDKLGSTQTIPPITVKDGSSSNDQAAIIRFCYKNEHYDYLTLTAGETFADVDEQFLAFMDSDNKLYHVRTKEEAYGSVTGSIPESLFIVDQKLEGAAVTSGNSLSYCYPYRPVSVDEIDINQVSGTNDVYIQWYGIREGIFLEAIEGTIVNAGNTIFRPTSLFASATESETGTPISNIATFTGTAASASVNMDDGTTDYTDYAAVDGDAAYCIMITEDTAPNGVFGYIGEVTNTAGTDYLMKIYDDPVITSANQSWIGAAADILIDFASTGTDYYIFPIDKTFSANSYEVYESDDRTADSATIEMISRLTGITILSDALAGATSVYFTKYGRQVIPDNTNGDIWSGGNYKKESPVTTTLGHTLALVAESSATPKISGTVSRK